MRCLFLCFFRSLDVVFTLIKSPMCFVALIYLIAAYVGYHVHAGN
jgi:ABC-type transporter Mla maintaining outer membrane lipid asymmetry permease subunit MlaE